MKASRSMHKLAAAASATLMFAATAHGYSDAAVKDAEQLLEKVTRDVANGYGKASDRLLAEYYLLEMKYKAGRIRRSKFCDSVMPILESMKSLAQQQAQNGYLSVPEEIGAKRRYYKTEAFCRNK